ncbi:MAG: HNH endonuclease [Clostridia bacterium]
MRPKPTHVRRGDERGGPYRKGVPPRDRPKGGSGDRVSNATTEGDTRGTGINRETERRAYRAYRQDLWGRVRAVGYIQRSPENPALPVSLTRRASPHTLATVARLLGYPQAQALVDELWAYHLPSLPPDWSGPPSPAVRKRVSAPRRRALWERDQGRCGLCGQPVTYDDAVIDHIQPVAHGGLTTPENLQMAHPSCNAYKSSSPNPSVWRTRVAAIKRGGRPVSWLVVEETIRERGRISWDVVPSPEYEAERRSHWWAKGRVVREFSTRRRALQMIWKLYALPELCGACQRAWADHQDDGSCPE